MTEWQAPPDRRDRRRGRKRLALIGLFVAGVLCSAVALGSGGAGARPALTAITTPAIKSCVIYQCVTVTVGVYAANSPNSPEFDGPFTGSGEITSKPPGIACTVVAGIPSGTCSATLQLPLGSPPTIELDGTPAPGSLACETYCRATSLAPTSQGAIVTLQTGTTTYSDTSFAFKLDTEALTVTKTGNGTGTITTDPVGLSCGTHCLQRFDYGSAVKLIAAPDAGASFTQWTGACAGQPATCSLTLKAATSTNAVFGLAATTTTSTSTTTTKAATTTAATTTTSSTTTTTQATTTGGAGRSVDADLLAVKSGRSKLGARIVQVEFDLGETATIQISLSRKGTPLAARTIGSARQGDRVFTLGVPRTVAKGPALVRITVSDKSGHRRAFARSVSIAKQGR